jgi:hypothetical protein
MVISAHDLEIAYCFIGFSTRILEQNTDGAETIRRFNPYPANVENMVSS